MSLAQGYNPTEEAVLLERYPSAIPFLPPLSASTVKYYYQFYAFAVGLIILFGGLLSPALEVNLGLGGTPFVHAVVHVWSHLGLNAYYVCKRLSLSLCCHCEVFALSADLCET